MDPKITQLAVTSAGLIGAAGDFSNKVKGLIRGTGSLSGSTLTEMQKDLQDVVKFALESAAVLSITLEK